MKFDYAKYYKEKYKNDPVYRKKRIALSNKWTKNNKDKVNAKQRRYYHNKTPEQIEERKQKVKEMRALGKWKKWKVFAINA